MPTVLLLSYTAYSEIVVPNEIAEQLKATGAWADKHGNLHYTDNSGKDQVIEGVQNVEYKRADHFEWMDPVVEPEQKKEKVRCKCSGCQNFDTKTD